MKLSSLVPVFALLCSALMAGLFFSYSISVSPGLNKLSDQEYLRAMQSINREIQNPIFFLCFVGLLILLPWATVQQFSVHKISFMLLLAASAFYIIGVFGITATVNVPLNDQLDAFTFPGSAFEIQRMRALFEKKMEFL